MASFDTLAGHHVVQEEREQPQRTLSTSVWWHVKDKAGALFFSMEVGVRRTPCPFRLRRPAEMLWH